MFEQVGSRHSRGEPGMARLGRSLALPLASPIVGFAHVIVLVLVLIVGPKLFIEPGTKAFFPLSSVSGPGL
jgi:hypothetical protein